jgi:pyridinium-3,5-bisthiocarboxylic acid mononucleotide nickel chelatase
MKILYLDPILGISGDMTISALVDAGLPFERIETVLKALPVSFPSIVPVKKRLGVIEGTNLEIAHSHTHFSPAEMERFMDAVPEEEIRNNAKSMLRLIVEAESKVHGVAPDSVHLHELSSIDTLIDLVGVAAAIHFLGIEKVYSGPVPHGRGTINTHHGIMPNPPPATLEILKDFKTVFIDIDLELTTPTGATIVKHYVKDESQLPPIKVRHIGYGLGSYTKTEKPDALRIFIGETVSPSSDEEVYVIEADLDDMEAEYLGACAERMRQAGALDVLYFPVYMKKGRLGTRLSLTVPAALLEDLAAAVLRETTTFGMRVRREGRRVLRREVRTVETEYGPVRVKYGYDAEGNQVKTHIEFDDVKKIADEKQLPYRHVLEALRKEIG